MCGLEDWRARNTQSRREKKSVGILNRNSGGRWVMGTQKRPSRTNSQQGIGGLRPRNLSQLCDPGLVTSSNGPHFLPLQRRSPVAPSLGSTLEHLGSF